MMYLNSEPRKKRTNHWFIFFLLILNLLNRYESCPGQSQDSSFTEIFKKWEDSIPKLTESQKIQGLAIAVADERGILWAEGFGYTDTSHNMEVDANTLFSIQSMSKKFHRARNTEGIGRWYT